MKPVFAISLAIALLLGACAPAAPTSVSVDSQATAQVLAQTMAAQTIAAMPTNTPLPTATPTLAPTATATLEPSPVASPTMTATGTATSLPTAINRYGRPAPLKLINNSDYTVDLWITGPEVHHENFKLDNVIYLPLGTYTFVAYVGKKTYSGTMFINNPDQWELVFFNDRYNFNSP